MVPVGEDTQEAQQLSQNDNHDDDHEEEENEEEDEDDEDYTPLSDLEKEKEYHITDEIKTCRNEALIPTGRLRELLNCVAITTLPEFRVKRVLRPRREEYKAIMEILSGPNVLSHHQGLAFRATDQAAVGDTAWQAITTYNREYHDKLKNIVYHLLPQRKMDKFKASGVMANIPRMLMVHHQDIAMGKSSHLQETQWEIQSLRDQLRDSDATIRVYQRMVASEASELYASDTNTWSATFSGLGARDKLAVNSHSPSNSHTR
jgi:hypothetical protein